MYYPDDLIEEVRSKNDIVDVISSRVKLQKKGSSYFGLCPFHNEKSPSFSVSGEKQMYYCFGCGAGGNVFTFEMEYENYSFQEAVKSLADRVGVKLPEAEYSPEAKRRADLKNSILEVNKLAANYFYYQLGTEKGKQAYDYLANRELSDDTMKHFGLGYSNKYSDDLYKYVKGKGFSDEVLRESGLFTYSEKGVFDKFWNRVMFPIMDVNSKVIGFGGRVMGDGEPKYLNSPETVVFDKSRNLYGLNFARTSKRGYILLCEGYMDVIALHQAGFTNAVAALGTAFTQGHANLLKRYTDNVCLTFDSDEAGTKAALRAVPILRSVGINAKVINMKPYKDPDEFIKNLGAEEYEKRISEANNSFMFEVMLLETKYNLKDPAEKTKFDVEVAVMLAETFEDPMERENYIKAVAEKYNIGYENLRTRVATECMKRDNTVVKVDRPKVGINSNRDKVDGMKQSQKLLITWLIEEPYIYNQIKKYIKPSDFTEKLYEAVATILFEQLENGEVNPAKIINYFTDEEEHKEAASLFNARLKEVDTKADREKALNETFLRVMENSINVINSTLEPTDIAGLQRVIELKKNLEEIKKLHITLN